MSIILLAALTGFTHITTNIPSTSIYSNLLNDAIRNSDNSVELDENGQPEGRM